MGVAVPTLASTDQITLKYTYRPEQTRIGFLTDRKGKLYLPLGEVAQFYGIHLQFDDQTRSIFLSKNNNQVKLVLSQPMFLVSNPTETFPTDPATEIDGQLAVTPSTAADILVAILGINTCYSSDQQTLVVGGIRTEAVKKEIAAQETKTPSPLEAKAPAPGSQTVSGPRGEEQLNSAQEQEINPNQGYHVRCIVIDPGHGGKDTGAIGYDGRYDEKQATLAIAKIVVHELRQQPGLKVLMTRTGDYFVTLRGRTQFANRNKADLFVSIHCNSTPNRNDDTARGTEIYVYSKKSSNHFADFEANRENEGNVHLSFMDDLRYQAYKARSYFLAEEVWDFIKERLHQHMRRVQQADFYVLSRVNMPSILIETAFISNEKEENELRNPVFQKKIATAIADGILAYRNTIEESYQHE